jgi:hypothetical protein
MTATPIRLSLPKGFSAVPAHTKPLQDDEAYLAVGVDGIVGGGCYTESPETLKWFTEATDAGARIVIGPREAAGTMLGVSLAVKGMLLASKSGNISAAELIGETNDVWVLKVEKSEYRVSKSDPRKRAFKRMSEALQWSSNDQELIDHWVARDAAESVPL